MIKPVDTRWNSKSQMIARAIYLKSAINDICSRESITALYNTGALRLKQEEWVILEQLGSLLDVCAILFRLISCATEYSP